MDVSHIEATQALDFGDDETDEDIDLNTPVAHLNVRCQKGFPGKLFPIFEGDNVIGRHDECQVAIPLKALSREHACIEVKSGSHFIYDKGSRNRTKRNTHFLAAAVRYELKDKDKLIFGDVECEYQLQSGNDDGSETESESMFQTAPADNDYQSDASSDILEPTQPFTKTTQSFLGTKPQLGETTIEQNLSVEDTPEPNRTKKITENVVVPESGSDTEGEEDFQKDISETSADKSSILIAETQSYVCESDVTTDNEDDIGDKSSFMVAPTQAFIHGDGGDDDDISTCSEASPEKKHLMMAATQAYVGESDDSVSPKKKLMFEPTQAYTMDVGFAPTIGYDIDAEGDSETEEEDEKQPGILFEPTQAYAGNDLDADEDDGNESEASEEFEEPVGFDDPTLAVENVFTENKITKSSAITVTCETQVFEDQSGVETKTNVQITDASVGETQVFEQVIDDAEKNNKGIAAEKQPSVPTNDANVGETHVFEEVTETDDIDIAKETKTSALITDANEVVTNDTENNNKDKIEEKKKEDKISQGCDKQTAPTQTVSDEDDDDDTFDFLGTSTLAVESMDSEESNHSADKHSAEADNEQSTQVFDNADETCAITEDTSETDGDKHKKNFRPSKKANDNDDATQVFDDTVSVQEDATVVIEDSEVKSGRKETKSVKSNNHNKHIKAKADPVVQGDEQTQVFDETVAVEEIAVSKQAATDDSTQVFDETVPVDEMAVKVNAMNPATEDATQVFNETVAVEDTHEEARPTRGTKKGSKKTIKVNELSTTEDATQVFDETVAVEDICEETKPIRGGKKGPKKTPQVTAQTAMEDATQVFDETVAVEDIPEETKQTRRGKKGTNKTTKVTEISAIEDATQVIDETVAVEDIHEETKTTRGGKKGSKKTTKVTEPSATEAATQVFEETIAVEGIEQNVEPECKNDTIKSQANVSGETDKNKPEFPETEEKVIVRKSGKRRQTNADKSETSNTHIKTSNTVRTGRSRTRGNKSSNNDIDDASKSEKPNPTKTEEVKESVNVKKSGRNSSKVVADKADEKQTDNGRKSARNKKNVSKKDTDDTLDQSVGKATRKGKKTENNKQIVEPEAATQIYAEDNTADGAATQIYGDDESDDGSLTPDIETVLAQEANQSNTPVIETLIPAKSPLKSALAGPKKERSPSPKKVQFVSQKSGTESESSQNTRRSNRANKGKAKVKLCAEESKPVAQNKNKDVDTPDVVPEVSKVKVDTGKSSRRGKRGVRSEEPATEVVAVSDNLDKTTDCVPVTSRRQGRSVKVNSVKQKSKDKIEELKEKSETVDTSKVIRRGERRSTNTCSNVDVKPETSKVTRTSLPIVLEEKIEENTKTDQTVKGNSRTSKRKIEVTNVSKESDEKQTISDVGKKEPIGSRRSKRQNKDEDSKSIKSDETENRNSAEMNDLRPSRRGTRHKEQGESVTDESENTQTDAKKSKVLKAVKNESKSDTTQANEKNSSTSETKKVSRKGKKDSVVGSSKSDSNSQEVQESVSGNKRSSRRNAGGDNDVVTEKSTDNSKVKTDKTGDHSKVKNNKTLDSSDVKKGGVITGTSKTSGRLKRKESASSSNDSQESELDETPAKKQRRGKAPAISTPVSSSKQKSLKQLEESVSHSPTLRKSTIEGVKAKVMFTGVVDEQGQKIVKELGGELVNSVIDCTHLVTDQVRRTVKFLCCLARGIPIVVPQWLISSKASGFFIDAVPFLVTDDASQRKFKFRLDHSIDRANKKRMFDGYTFHVTKSVKPEPAQMKDILKCSGAEYCDTMPASTRSGNVVVISCIEDKALCTPAVKAGIPVMSAEFVLTGILRQDVDMVSLDIGAEGNKRSLPQSQTETSKKRKR